MCSRRRSGSNERRSTTRAIGATAASAPPHGRAWAVIASRRRPHALQEARVPRPAVPGVGAVLRPCRADLRRGQPPAGRVPRADAGDVPRLPRRSRTRSCSSSRSTPAPASSPTTAAPTRCRSTCRSRSRRLEYIFGKLAILVALLLLVTWVPGAAAPGRADCCLPATSRSFWTTCTSFPPSRSSRSSGSLTAASVMLALSSLSKSSRYVGVLYAGLIFFTQALYGVLRAVTASSSMAWVSVDEQPEPDRRRDLPPARRVADLPWIVSLVDHRRPDRRRRRWCSSGASAVSRCRVSAAIVAADHVSKWYGQVIGLNDVTLTVPPGITGLLGPNGAGQVHVHEADHRAAEAEQGPADRARRADLEEPGAVLPHRLLSGAGRVLRSDDRASSG